MALDSYNFIKAQLVGILYELSLILRIQSGFQISKEV